MNEFDMSKWLVELLALRGIRLQGHFRSNLALAAWTPFCSGIDTKNTVLLHFDMSNSFPIISNRYFRILQEKCCRLVLEMLRNSIVWCWECCFKVRDFQARCVSDSRARIISFLLLCMLFCAKRESCGAKHPSWGRNGGKHPSWWPKLENKEVVRNLHLKP